MGITAAPSGMANELVMKELESPKSWKLYCGALKAWWRSISRSLAFLVPSWSVVVVSNCKHKIEASRHSMEPEECCLRLGIQNPMGGSPFFGSGPLQRDRRSRIVSGRILHPMSHVATGVVHVARSFENIHLPSDIGSIVDNTSCIRSLSTDRSVRKRRQIAVN